MLKVPKVNFYRKLLQSLCIFLLEKMVNPELDFRSWEEDGMCAFMPCCSKGHCPYTDNEAKAYRMGRANVVFQLLVPSVMTISRELLSRRPQDQSVHLTFSSNSSKACLVQSRNPQRLLWRGKQWQRLQSESGSLDFLAWNLTGTSHPHSAYHKGCSTVQIYSWLRRQNPRPLASDAPRGQFVITLL